MLNLVSSSTIKNIILASIITALGSMLEILNLTYLTSLINYLLDSSTNNFLTVFSRKYELSFQHLIIINIAISCLATATILFGNYRSIRIGQNARSELAVNMSAKFIDQTIKSSKKLDPDDMTKEIVSETDAVVNFYIMPIINIINGAIFVLSITSYLIFTKNILAISMMCLIIIIFFFSYFILRRFVSKSADKRNLYNSLRFKSVSESIRAQPDLLIYGLKNAAVRRINENFIEFSASLANYNFITKLLRYLIEFSIFFGVLLFFLYSVDANGFLKFDIALIATSLFAFMKVIGPAQNIYNSLVSFRFAEKTIKNYTSLIDTFEKNKLKDISINNDLQVEKIIFKDVSFSFGDKQIFDKFNLVLNTNIRTALIGESGSGKSTLLSLICGLLEPDSGQITYEMSDGSICISSPSIIPFVTQDPFIFEGSLKKNIILESHFDKAIYKKALETACIQKLKSSLGDKMLAGYGANLSGGQKQRISLARALYKNKNFICLDEFTSALDSKTESNIFKELGLSKVGFVASTHKDYLLPLFDEVIEL